MFFTVKKIGIITIHLYFVYILMRRKFLQKENKVIMINSSKECYTSFGRNWPDLKKFRIYIGLNAVPK